MNTYSHVVKGMQREAADRLDALFSPASLVHGSKMPLTPCFAYGSNMDEEQILERCPDATPGGVATLADWQFLINERGVATVVASPDPGRVVWGFVWNLTDDDLRRLDKREGVGLELYSRRSLPLLVGDTFIPGEVYVAANTTPGVPRDGYLERIINAARRLEFTPQYIAELEQWR
jgi:Gamma-glutamyl cyclotransferase, AIG2-like